MHNLNIKKQLKTQQGVALFQVLLIITILLFLAIFVSNKAKMQVSSAQKIADKQAAMLSVTSTLAKIKFNLLTLPADRLHDKLGWNFYGKDFLFNKAKVNIQDHNGLLSINKNTQIKLLTQLIGITNKESDSVNAVSPTLLKQWFANTNNIRLQNLEQLTNIGFSYQAAKIIWSAITVNPRILFNPMNVPEFILPVFFDKAQVQQIIDLRADDNSYMEMKQQMRNITQISEDEMVGYITGPYYRVKISAKIGKSEWNMLYELSIVQQLRGLDILILSQRPL